MTVNTKISPLFIWFLAVRPRTLPLAAAAIFLGYGLAAAQGARSPLVFGLALITALLLQIVSNLANDYGDALNGADTAERLGPKRMVSSGFTSAKNMFLAIVFSVFAALVSGTLLLLVAAWGNWMLFGSFMALGAVCLIAAIAYTAGKNPYGYMGFGDLMAGVFFGPVAVLGTIFLCGASISGIMLLPAIAAGLCSTMVLNVNNMRDIETDARYGKKTVAVRLGLKNARYYHLALVGATLLCWIVFWTIYNPHILWSLIAIVPLCHSAKLAASVLADAACLNAQLRATVLSTALLHIVMSLACLWL